MDDEALHWAFQRVKDKLRYHDHHKRVFYEVRDNIDKVVQSCASNVKVKIYFDVLDDPIVIYAGSAENVLKIYIIDEDEKPRLVWAKETWAKCVKDAVSDFRKICLIGLSALNDTNTGV